MKTVQVVCCQCGKKFLRTFRRINESKKFGWRVYCSRQCLGKSKNHKVFLRCTRPGCNKSFLRGQNQIKNQGNFYCSRSCAVAVNNKKFPKRPANIKQCLMCSKNFTGNKAFCSRKCKNISQSIGRDEILVWINNFYQKEGRISLKKECPHEKAARIIFGSWNKAIETAGFSSNPVMFAKKYLANDGHKCDSLAEKIIDDWLTARDISHLKSPRYPNSKFTSDFKIGNTYLEFFGLSNSLKKYDQLMKEKLQMIKNNNFQLIQIYPKDIFPKSKLDAILGDFVQSVKNE